MLKDVHSFNGFRSLRVKDVARRQGKNNDSGLSRIFLENSENEGERLGNRRKPKETLENLEIVENNGNSRKSKKL